MKFSANLGFLWNDRPLANAIRAAKHAGFHAVECHWPYNEPQEDVREALIQTGLPMLGLNTRRGDIAAGEFGLSALPGREQEARAAIDEAIAYAVGIDAQYVHVMAGFASGSQATLIFKENLRYACDQAAFHNLTILIEPLNRYDAPGYYLQSSQQAAQFIDEVAADNLKLMFDCYHVQLMEGDLTNRLMALLPMIGHIQIASVPDRGSPDHGEINYEYLFGLLKKLGYDRPIGAEYRPDGDTVDSLQWMHGKIA